MSYWVNFLNKDGSVIQRTTYKYGETPSYNGSTPTYSDGSYYYSFTGWDKKTSPVYGTQIYTALYDIVGEVNNGQDEVASSYEFGPQYKYEINQLAKYMNMDGDELEDLLLAWTKNSSNRNLTYSDLINNINTKDDALCASAIYILSFEHLIVSDSTISNTASTDIAKGILNSDVVFKNVKRLFLMTADDSITDEDFVSYIPSNILGTWNDELAKVMGEDLVEVKVSGIYDAFKYSIDHAKQEAPVGNTYALTANAIYKIMSIAKPDLNISLDDVKASMNRMIEKANAEKIFDLSELNGADEAKRKQIGCDYSIYSYMCMFALMSGDSAYNILSNNFVDREFTSLDSINYVLNSDYIFKSMASVFESVQTGNYGNMLASSLSRLTNGSMISDIYIEYTGDYNKMYKAIGEILSN